MERLNKLLYSHRDWAPLLAAHTQDPITKSFPAWALWAMSICLSFLGAGKLAIDNPTETGKLVS